MAIEVALWPKGQGGSRLTIALHGRGGNEERLGYLGELMPSGMDLACLRAPLPLDDGWTWFENLGLGRPREDSIRQSADDVFTWLDANAAGYESVSILGMSAGTVMGGGLLLIAPERFASAVLFAGALPLAAGLDASPGRLAGIPVLWSIDTEDGVMPADLVARSEAWLVEESGAELVIEHPEGVGHAISPAMAASGAAFLAR